MSDDSQRPIVVKKVNKGGHGHHGGAWKIAYADFVTAMMAFFLLMWLLGSSTKGDLKGIADYFQNPFKVAMQEGSGAGESQSVLQGGGLDLSKKAGDKHRHKDQERLKKLKESLEKAIYDKTTTGQLSKFKDQILIDVTEEGLRIQIVDQKNRPMFKSGSSQMEPYAVEIIREIGTILNFPDLPNSISLSGHTDSSVFGGGIHGYSNWELSSERSNAARRELINGGLDPVKTARVIGLADSVPFDAQNPQNPINRRISMIILTEEATAKIRKLAGQVNKSPQDIGIETITH